MCFTYTIKDYNIKDMDQVRFALSYFVETYLPGGRKMNVLNHSIIPSDNEQSTSASAIDIAASLQLMILK